jgi:DNA-binding CsgD family transcriptional regulator/N-acetylneuraminic acid mutarotase
MPEYGEPLTEREQELVQLVATGVTNREVARRLNISVNTVKVHLRNIYTKIGAESRTEATMIAVREGWIVVEGAEAPEIKGDEIATSGAITHPPPLPLPRFKRAALIVTLLLAVFGVAVTQPRSNSQASNGIGPLLDQPPGRPGTVMPVEVESYWHERAHMLTRRAYLALAAAEGRIFAIAGQTSEGAATKITAATEIYDPIENLWTRGSDKPTPATYVSAVAIGTDIYVPGGCKADGAPTDTCEVYNALTDSWREISPLPKPRCAYALATLDDVIYLFGGWDGKQYAATVYVYDPHTDHWTEGTSMSTERGFAAAAALENRIFVVGGYDGERELTTCMAYDPAAEMWEECAPLSVGRGGLGLVNLSDQLYAVGGGGWTSYLTFNERYISSNDVWSAVDTPIGGEWRGPGAAVLENSIYAIGGRSSDYLSSNQMYEPPSFRIFIPISHGQ